VPRSRQPSLWPRWTTDANHTCALCFLLS
jgi:hypothetical protein